MCPCYHNLCIHYEVATENHKRSRENRIDMTMALSVTVSDKDFTVKHPFMATIVNGHHFVIY